MKNRSYCYLFVSSDLSQGIQPHNPSRHRYVTLMSILRKHWRQLLLVLAKFPNQVRGRYQWRVIYTHYVQYTFTERKRLVLLYVMVMWPDWHRCYIDMIYAWHFYDHSVDAVFFIDFFSFVLILIHVLC